MLFIFAWRPSLLGWRPLLLETILSQDLPLHDLGGVVFQSILAVAIHLRSHSKNLKVHIDGPMMVYGSKSKIQTGQRRFGKPKYISPFGFFHMVIDVSWFYGHRFYRYWSSHGRIAPQGPRRAEAWRSWNWPRPKCPRARKRLRLGQDRPNWVQWGSAKKTVRRCSSCSPQLDFWLKSRPPCEIFIDF